MQRVAQLERCIMADHAALKQNIAAQMQQQTALGTVQVTLDTVDTIVDRRCTVVSFSPGIDRVWTEGKARRGECQHFATTHHCGLATHRGDIATHRCLERLRCGRALP